MLVNNDNHPLFTVYYTMFSVACMQNETYCFSRVFDYFWRDNTDLFSVSLTTPVHCLKIMVVYSVIQAF